MTAGDVFAGAVELLTELRAARVGVGIASASRNCRRVLKRTGLERLVDAVADGNDVTATKPDPAVFLLAAERLGVPAGSCAGVEDAAAGIEAIRRAGMGSVGIGGRAAGGDVSVATIGEVSVGMLREVQARAGSRWGLLAGRRLDSEMMPRDEVKVLLPDRPGV